MPFKIEKDAEPQFNLLLAATAISLLIWLISLFFPFFGYLLYPLRLFATFVHEGGHAIAGIISGSDVSSLTVSPDGSGEVYSIGTGGFSALLVSSAGYLGTTAFGTLLLFLIRFGFSARKTLYFCGGLVFALTVFFGFLAPIRHLFNTVTIGGFFFTVFSGLVISGILLSIAKYARSTIVNFTIAFITVQMLLNATFDLINVFFISTTTNMHSDAANMAAATGIPAFIWVLIWIALSVVMISLGLRIYVIRKNQLSDRLYKDL